MSNVILTFLAVFGMGISTLYALSPTSRARGLVQPVFHNVQKHHIAIITDLVQRRPYCSISLRHDEAIDSLRSLRTKIREISGKCVVGASTVSTIEQCKQSGAGFISTVTTDPALIRYCVSQRIPIFSGVKTLEEFETSISCGANFLKVHPSSAVSPESLSIILDKVGKTVLDSSQPWRTFVSGSIEPRHILPYLQAGATDFIVGLDAAQLSHSEMKQKLDEMDWELERVREQLRDTPMLRSVCL